MQISTPVFPKEDAMHIAARRRTTTHTIAVGTEYSDEDLDFLRAVEQYKRKHRRPFPTWTEVLDILKALGYRKVAVAREPEHPP